MTETIELDTLQRLKMSGAESPVLDARIAWSKAHGMARYAEMIAGVDRVYPTVLMTAQASGRFSTTDPPLLTFPSREHDEEGNSLGPAWGMIRPDSGTIWVAFDLDALHARIAACYTKDSLDLEAFRQGWDLHTLTACQMWKIPFPESPTKTVHTAPCLEWCQHGPGFVNHHLGCPARWRKLWDPPWEGEKDRRRRLAKVMRYALLLGLNETAALEAKETAELGLTREEVLHFARLYLKSKPETVAGKRKIMEECARTSMAWSFKGRLRRLYGQPNDRKKEGWSHILQGGEQDIMDILLLDIYTMYPEMGLILHGYDGAVLSFPGPFAPVGLKSRVERTWEINGVQMPIPATWKEIRE